ncbi:MAG: class I tRNA ligase family protein, partial [Candidatus Melainabacteria bacterium]|nr:class I tRNA ligase family protein [Candidatus Melainabacteria bacterium]
MNYKDTLNLPQTDFPMKGDGPRREPEIQKFWFDNNIYQKVLEERKKQNKGKFLLHDGPPYLSSGNIHIGTALNKILKDIVVKYKTLRGFNSPYLPGFDCHGLPIESAISKEQKKDGAKLLDPLEVRKQCTEFVMKNRKLQEEKFKRLGVLGDWEHAYMTIDPKFEAAQLRLFGEMVEKNYIYRGLKPVFWCATCQTALAEAEVEYVENHKSP